MDNPTILNMLSLPIRQLTLLSILTALCIGFQLSPRPPNVEFTSLIVFLVGALFGIPIGAGLGILVMFINGFFSPWGFGGLNIPFQTMGMAMIGIGGGLYKREKAGSYDVSSFVETAILGAFLTLVYDIITNLGFAITYWLAGTPILIAITTAMVSGAPLSLVHIVSNTIVFAVLFFPVTNTLRKLLGGEHHWKREPLLT
jgi:hypothetical protein